MAAAVSSHQDTYKATAVFLVWVGLLHLLDMWLSFSSLGVSWILQKDMILLYAAIIFLWFKSDKSVGLILAGVWLVQDIDLVIAFLGQMSAFLLPITFLLLGVLLYWLSSR